jgi:2-dehydro-3-deoxygalactonokinase
VAASAANLPARPDFDLAVRRTAEESLPFLAAIFSVRARQLLGKVAPEDNLAYLSGLLVGGEIAAARAAGWLTTGTPLRIIGAQALGGAYSRAFELVGRSSVTLDGGELAKAGLLALARAIDLAPELTR